MTEFTLRTIERLRGVPPGRVVTYGGLAAAAGNPLGARQVVRVLNSCASGMDLPWHRVVNAHGRISLPAGAGYELQKALLAGEGVLFDDRDCIDLTRYLWKPRAAETLP